MNKNICTAVGIIAAASIAGLIMYGDYRQSHPPLTSIEGTVTLLQDSGWMGQWTVVRLDSGQSVRIAGLWGKEGTRIKSNAVVLNQ